MEAAMDTRDIVKVALLVVFSVILTGCSSQPEQKQPNPTAAPTAAQPPEPEPVDAMPQLGPWIHDPSALHFENGHFIVFSSGYRKDYNSGKMVEGLGINSWHRDSKTGAWQLADVLFTGADKPAWWDELVPNQGGFWAPDVPFKWVLYYSFEAEDDSASAIGRAVAEGAPPNLKWKDDGIVLLAGPCRRKDALCPIAIDPAVFADKAGNLYMAYGSGTTGIWIVELDASTGHLSRAARKGWSQNNPAYHHVAYRDIEADYIEAPYVYRHPHNGYYYLFVNWGGCCRGLKSTYNIRVGRSKSPTGPYLDKSGKDMLAQGGSMLIQSHARHIGPGHPAIYEHTDGRFAFSFHYYDRDDQGKARLAVRNLTWLDNWPVVAKTDFFRP